MSYGPWVSKGIGKRQGYIFIRHEGHQSVTLDMTDAQAVLKGLTHFLKKDENMKKKQDVINDVEDSPKMVLANGTTIKSGKTAKNVEPAEAMFPGNGAIFFSDDILAAPAPTLPPAPIPGITQGLMVHYVIEQDHHRPGIISSVVDPVEGVANVIVFFDGPNDGRNYTNPVEWRGEVEYSEFHVNGTWHFIEKA